MHPENISYYLLGILDINMPLRYGEGARAFLNLRREIIRYLGLAWGGSDAQTLSAQSTHNMESGALATNLLDLRIAILLIFGCYMGTLNQQSKSLIMSIRVDSVALH